MRLRTLGTIAAATVLVAVPGDLGLADADDRAVSPTVGSSTVTSGAHSWEHRYRASGSVWLLFWVSRDDVGGARMARREAGSSTSITFLGGSDPGRAPRNLNRWGYSLEDVTGSDARTFVVRSLAPNDADEPEAKLAEGTDPALFAAACGSVQPSATRSSVTAFRVPPTVTFHRFDRLLTALDSSQRWETIRGDRPASSYPGFFSALQSAIDDSVAGARAGTLKPAVTRRPYVFRGNLYDMILRKVERVSGGQLRGRFTYRNRSTGENAHFTIVFGADGDLAGVPIEMSFQPSWWVRVQLRLDDSTEVPDDPLNDRASAERIRAICSRVLGADPS